MTEQSGVLIELVNSGMVVGRVLIPMPSPRKVYMKGKAYGEEDEAPELDIHLLVGPKKVN